MICLSGFDCGFVLTGTLQASVALLAALFFAVRAKGSRRIARFSKRAIWVLIASAGLLYLNPVLLRGMSFVHYWEFFHYYLAAKYFPEVGYQGLYRCVSIADAENGHRAELTQRPVRDLRTLEIESASVYLSNPSLCKREFTLSRWASFRRDVDFFRQARFYRGTTGLWPEAQLDYGFNGTPVWVILARALASSGEASDRQLLALALVDIVFLMFTWGVIYSEFGWVAFGAAFIFWASFKPSEFTWGGGAYLRQDWLLLTLLGVVFLKRGRAGLAGGAITFASALRGYSIVIPLVLGTSECFRMLRVRSWRLSRDARCFVAGAAATAAIVVPVSTLACGRSWSVWLEFFKNAQRYLRLEMLNRIGLPDLSTAPDTRVIAVVLAVILVLTAIRRPHWQTAILSLGLLPLLFSINCYYYALYLLFGLLPGDELPGIEISLCGLAAASQLIPIFAAPAGIYRWTTVVILLFVLTVVRLTRNVPNSPLAVESNYGTFSA